MNDTGLSTHDIEAKIAAGRGETVEWLDADVSLECLAATLAALANTRGGLLLIGVSPAEQVDGGTMPDVTNVADPHSVIDRVLTAALALAPRLIIPVPQSVEIRGKRIIVVGIDEGLPHVYALNGQYWQRHGTDNCGIPPHELRQLFMARGEMNFEMDVAVGATLDDLHWGKAQSYARQLSGMRGQVTEQILLKRGCLVESGEGLNPTIAGILLFGYEPQRFVRGSDITAVRFAGETMSDTFSRQDITGTLPEQIQQAETFLVDHLRKGVQLTGMMARNEQYEYPMEAARELVVNAVAHRDYSIQGDGIRLYLFKQRLEVTSPGKLPGPVTVANIEDERFSRNPTIVQVLADMGYIERLGYGVKRVIELMRKQQLLAPEFKETGAGFKVILQRKWVEKAEPLPEKQIEPASDLATEYKRTPLNPRQQAALTYLSQPEHDRITNSELQRLFPDVHAETIRRDLADLVVKSLVTKMGQKRGSYYVLASEIELSQKDSTHA